MRKKQIGPELKLFELDTLKYITPHNIRDYIHYIGIYPERMSAADVTFARKSGLLDSSYNRLVLSKIALHYILDVITYREYAFLILSKQWIKTTNIKDPRTIYNESLLARLLNEIQTQGRMSAITFIQEIDNVVSSIYAPIVLSNSGSIRYIKGLLLATELVVDDGGFYTINPLASALVADFIKNSKHIVQPTEETEFESYWNSMEHGVFDIITPSNSQLYSSFYPNLIK